MVWFVAAAIGGALFDFAMHRIGAAVKIVKAASGTTKLGKATKVFAKTGDNVVYISKDAKGAVHCKDKQGLWSGIKTGLGNPKAT